MAEERDGMVTRDAVAGFPRVLHHKSSSGMAFRGRQRCDVWRAGLMPFLENMHEVRAGGWYDREGARSGDG